MTHTFRFKTLAGLGLALVITACGGGGGGGGNGAARPQADISVAPGETVEAGATVTFDGSASTSPTDGTLSYQWALIERPEGSAVMLSDDTAAVATLVPDVPGSWSVSLVVNDGNASSKPAHQRITVTAPAQPLAVIRPVSGAMPGIAIQLDGSGSLPPGEGDYSQLDYQWTLLEKPLDSTAELDDPASIWPRFTPDQEGSYRVQLIVQFGELASAPVEQVIEVLAEAAPPTAVATVLTENPLRGQVVQLDASQSFDPEGRPLNYFWSFGSTSGQPYPDNGRPNGSNTVIENPTSATPTFTPDVVGSYRFMLMVWSDKRVSIGSVVVTVGKPEGEPNTPPVAAFAPSYYSYSYEQEPGIGSQQRVNLGHASWDADGDSLTREYTLLSHPSGFDPATSYSSDAWSTAFQPTHEGNYAFQLRVFDGTEWSEPVTQVYRIRTGANMGPVAKVKTSVGAKVSTLGGAMLRATTLVGDTVTLDGTESDGGNGDQVFYQWELAYKPPGSNAVLDEFRATHPKFTADREGPYLVRLRVRDADGLESRNQAEILIVAKSFNSPPVLRPVAGANYYHNGLSMEQPVLLDGVNQPVIFISPNALDPDGDVVDTLATLIDAPAGFEWPEVTQWTRSTSGERDFSSSNAGFIGPRYDGTEMNVSGTYVFELIASDGMDRSATHVATFPTSTLADYPTLLMRGAFNSDLYFWPDRSFEERTLSQIVFGTTTWLNISQWYVWAGEALSEAALYELRAPVGQSWTIVDLKAESEDPDAPVSFIGLSEGQVIQGGAPLQFKLGVTRFPDRTTPDPDNPEHPFPQAKWSFRIQEKPAWTFQVGAWLSGSWHEYQR